MVWPLVKITIFILILATFSFITTKVMDLDGNLQLVLLDHEFSTTPIVLFFALIAIIPLIWLLFFILGLLSAFIRFAVGDQTALTRYLDKNRERHGYEALSESMVAMASGDHRSALDKISIAEKHLNRPELTGLLAAQASERCGNRQQAMTIYKGLLDRDQTMFSGLAGILKYKLEEGDTEVALKLADRASKLKPNHEEIQSILLRLQARSRDWIGAQQTLKQKFKNRFLTRQQYDRGIAVFSLAEALDALENDSPQVMQHAAYRAIKLAQGLVPAAVLAANIHMSNGEKRTAARIITRAWNINPHHDLANAFAVLAPNETPAKKYTRFKSLVSKTPNHPESRMLMAELAIANNDNISARAALGDLATSSPTVRSLVIMATIERADNANESVIQNLLTRAVSASRGPQWTCDVCHYNYSKWEPFCEKCENIDTISWESILEPHGLSKAITQMIPLVLPAAKDSPEVKEDMLPKVAISDDFLLENNPNI